MRYVCDSKRNFVKSRSNGWHHFVTMSKSACYVLAALVFLIFTGCDTLTKHRLAGTYYRYHQDGTATLAVEKLRLTNSKFIIAMPLNGELAMDYVVEDGVIYVGGQPSQMCFTIDGLGIISNKGLVGIEGTYVRQVAAE